MFDKQIWHQKLTKVDQQLQQHKNSLNHAQTSFHLMEVNQNSGPITFIFDSRKQKKWH